MKQRYKPLGNKNRIGANVTMLRHKTSMKQKDLVIHMQIAGVDINPSSLSKLEGQTRIATDFEVFAISRIFNVGMETLFESS